MTENLPDWLAISLIIVSSISALYVCYIRPGYDKDRKDND